MQPFPVVLIVALIAAVAGSGLQNVSFWSSAAEAQAEDRGSWFGWVTGSGGESSARTVTPRPISRTVSSCQMQPSRFDPEVDFYLFRCNSVTRRLVLELNGTGLYADGGLRIENGSLSVDLPEYAEPVIRRVSECSASNRSTACRQFTFDAFRVSLSATGLQTLNIYSPTARSRSSVYPGMVPSFSPNVFKYHITVEPGTSMVVTAEARYKMGRVGIEYLGASGSSGLGAFNGCDKASNERMVWTLEAPSSEPTGIFPYRICAVAPDFTHVLSYNFSVEFRPYWSGTAKMRISNFSTLSRRLSKRLPRRPEDLLQRL